MPAALKLVNKRFGNLLVIKRLANNKIDRSVWLCLCDCGREYEVTGERLNNEGTKYCRKCSFVRKQKPPGTIGFRRLKKNYTFNAKNRNYEFNLTDEELHKLFSSNCFYCGIAPYRVSTHDVRRVSKEAKDNGCYIYNGIDRVNNKFGYITSNVVACCKNCNLWKRDLSEEEFKNQISRIYKHLCLNIT